MRRALTRLLALSFALGTAGVASADDHDERYQLGIGYSQMDPDSIYGVGGTGGGGARLAWGPPRRDADGRSHSDRLADAGRGL